MGLLRIRDDPVRRVALLNKNFSFGLVLSFEV
jgi:hypothetical protein